MISMTQRSDNQGMVNIDQYSPSFRCDVSHGIRLFRAAKQRSDNPYLVNSMNYIQEWIW